MRIAFLVNDPDTEIPLATSVLLAHRASKAGHQAYLMGVKELSYLPGGDISAKARKAPVKTRREQRAFLQAMQGPSAPREEVSTADLDVLWLRYNPSEEMGDDAWAQEAGILFGQAAARTGVIVLNDPSTLAHALNKFYLQHFPERVRPRTLITRDPERVRAFYEEEGRKAVVKPLMGYGGTDVYLFEQDGGNLVQVVETLARTGYVIAQEFLPAAALGDTRLFLVNGAPLVVDGRVAAVRRVAKEGDFRSNMAAGASAEAADVDDAMLELASLVGAKLRKDGIFFAGLDVVGDRLVEINAISSGGLNIATELEGVDFGSAVIEAVARKVEYRRLYGARLSNRELATLL